MVDENKEMNQQQKREMQDQSLQENMAKIKHKVIVISGKGGVGKSTVSVNLAIGLSLQGKKVGILDIDIHGPSLAKMLGIEGQMLVVDDQQKLQPIQANGLSIVTIASMLRDTDAPVIWRGPLKMNVIKQFLSEVNWGDLDYLVIDSPPGTGDEPLSICQLIPEADGTVIVTTPQDVALIDSRKAIRFSEALKMPVLGIIENMSGLACPHCGKSIELFKMGGGEKAAQELNMPFLGRISIDPEIVQASDAGKPYIQEFTDNPAAQSMNGIVEKIVEATNK